MRIIRAYADGSYSYETGSAGIGVKIITPTNKVCYESSSWVGLKESQEIEYVAQFNAVMLALQHYKNPKDVILYLHSDCSFLVKDLLNNRIDYDLLHRWNIYIYLNKFADWHIKRRQKENNNHMEEVDRLSKMEMQFDQTIMRGYFRGY